MERDALRFKFKHALIFGVIFTALGFPLGLLSLTVGPTRMISNYCISHEISVETENILQKVFLFLLAFFLILASLKGMDLFVNRFRALHRTILLVCCGVSILASAAIFTFKPELLIETDQRTTTETSGEAEFHFGPYPDEAKLEKLKKQRYAGIISLLNPMVVPAEPILMKQEKENTQKVGIELISVPMLPWISENDSSKIKIKEIAKTFKGKYYVHCYLGKDRANVFKRLISEANTKIKVSSELKVRSIAKKERFERGPLVLIEKDVYLAPYPTDEEFFAYLLNGQVKTVVSMLDPKNPDEKARVEKDIWVMDSHHQSFLNYPLRERDRDDQIRTLCKKIKALPKPVVVYAYKSDSYMAKNFVKIYQNQGK